MTTTITTYATKALTDLVHTARSYADRAERVGLRRGPLDEMAQTFDRARTRLVEDGADYLDAAWAFVDAGRRTVAQWRRIVERREAQVVILSGPRA